MRLTARWAVTLVAESRAADEIEGVRLSLWHSAAGAIPAEVLALARLATHAPWPAHPPSHCGSEQS